jgi:hypothetical protein
MVPGLRPRTKTVRTMTLTVKWMPLSKVLTQGKIGGISGTVGSHREVGIRSYVRRPMFSEASPMLEKTLLAVQLTNFSLSGNCAFNT